MPEYLFITAIAALFCCGAVFYIVIEKKKGLALASFLDDAMESVPHGLLFFGQDEKLKKDNRMARILIPELGEGGDTLLSVDGFLDFVFAHRVHDNNTFASCAPVDPLTHDFREVMECHDKICLMQATHIHSGELVVFLTDITDLKRREEDLLRLHRENYELIQAVEATSNGLVITNPKEPDNPVIFVNRAFCEMTGLVRDDIIGSDWAEVLAAQAHIPDTKNVMDLMSDEKPAKLEWGFKKEEKIVSYQLVVSPVLGKKGDLDLFIAIQTDITEVKMQEVQFIQAQKLEALGQLAGGVAHDFNNVLSIIDGYARMASKAAPENDDQLVNYLERIKQASKRGAGLTKQLLLFGRHKIVGDTVVDISRMISEQERLLQPLLDSSMNLRLNVDNGLFVECPPDGLSQIIMNLVINARDAMPEGGMIIIDAQKSVSGALLNVVPEDKRDKDYVCLSVTDTGIGMDQKVIDRIFDPFFTTKEQGKGTGLGLSMVYGLVKEMEGYIDVSTVPGEGTSIRLYLPLSDKKVAKGINETADNAAGIRFDGYTVLVAEDEPDLLKVVSSMLEEMGIEVLAAKNGAEALVLQDEYEGDIDLLLSDVVMPELNGVKLAELIQAVREETKVIFMSGFPANGKMARIRIPEDSVLLAKPLDFEKLTIVMKKVLDEDGLDAENSGDLQRWQVVNG